MQLNKQNNIISKTVFFVLFSFIFTQLQSQISTFPYSENFETNNGGWVSGGSSSDWVYGTPNKPTITGAGSGTKCWIIGGLNLTGSGYNNNEASYVTSPTFDFSTLNYPWISFKLFWETEKNYDGGNLQYSINGGSSWVRVGAVGEAVDCMNSNWYNTSSISQLVSLDPSKQGWAGNHYPASASGSGNPNATGGSCQLGSGSGGWVVAKHCLMALAGRQSVKFRFTFGAGSTCNYYDGLAFDDILIQNGLANAPDFNYSCSTTQDMLNFTSNTPTCPSGGATTVLWNFGDPLSGSTNTSTAKNSSHLYSSPGIYTVSLTQSGGPCNPPGVITKTVNILNTTVTSYTNVTCNGGSDGAAVATADFGIAPFLYTWNPSGGSSNTATNLSAGNYYITIQDSKGCKRNATVSIVESSAIIATPNFTNVTCGGLSNGSASISVSGGKPSYTYTWLPTGGNSSFANNLPANTYSVIIKDSKNCQKTQTVSITEPTPISGTITSSNISCNSSVGSATVTASGGQPNYTYNWSNGSTNNTADLLGVGVISVIVTDNNNCNITLTQTIVASNSPVAVVSVTDAICYGSNTGKASVLVSGGTAPYNYLWSPTGGATNIANNLNAGSYTLKITDALGCIKNEIVNISQPPQIQLITSANEAICSGATTVLSSTVTNATTYTVNWFPVNSNGGTISVTPTASTTYTALVTDINNCKSLPKQVVISIAPSVTLNVVSALTVCENIATTINATTIGGTGNYTYSWLPSSVNASSITITTSIPKQYTVNVTDGCTSATKTVSVSVSQKPVIKSFSPVVGCNPLCVQYYDSALINSAVITQWKWDFNNGLISNSTSPVICFTSSGTYSGTLNVVNTDNCSFKLADITGITVNPIPVADFISDNGFESNQENTTFVLTNNSVDFSTVKWYADTAQYNGNSISQTFQAPGTYSVMLIATNAFLCNDTMIKLFIIAPELTFYAPNCFTPNKSGLNDVFLPKGTGWDLSKFKLFIFNRWGSLIFETNDAANGWDGTSKGVSVKDDTYIWQVELKDIYNEEYYFHGHVLLLR